MPSDCGSSVVHHDATWRGPERRTPPIAPESQNFVKSRWTKPWEKFPPHCGTCICALSYSVEAHTQGKKSSPVAMLASVIKCQVEHRLTPANRVSVL